MAVHDARRAHQDGLVAEQTQVAHVIDEFFGMDDDHRLVINNTVDMHRSTTVLMICHWS